MTPEESMGGDELEDEPPRHDVKNVAANLRHTRSKKFIHSARYDAAERNVVAAQPTTPHHPPPLQGQIHPLTRRNTSTRHERRGRFSTVV